MEFNEKLQELRKQKGLTQEELATALFVSRTAVSKWESGRGYPNIESIKEISKFFSVTIDELLSGEEVLNIAEENHKQAQQCFRSLAFGLLDMCVIMFFFLPFFGQNAGDRIESVALSFLTEVPLYIKVAYFSVSIVIMLYGLLMLIFQNSINPFWVQKRDKMSICLNAIAVLLFIISSQPYAATFLFVFLIIKILMLMNK